MDQLFEEWSRVHQNGNSLTANRPMLPMELRIHLSSRMSDTLPRKSLMIDQLVNRFKIVMENQLPTLMIRLSMIDHSAAWNVDSVMDVMKNFAGNNQQVSSEDLSADLRLLKDYLDTFDQGAFHQRAPFPPTDLDNRLQVLGSEFESTKISKKSFPMPNDQYSDYSTWLKVNDQVFLPKNHPFLLRGEIFKAVNLSGLPADWRSSTTLFQFRKNIFFNASNNGAPQPVDIIEVISGKTGPRYSSRANVEFSLSEEFKESLGVQTSLELGVFSTTIPLPPATLLVCNVIDVGSANFIRARKLEFKSRFGTRVPPRVEEIPEDRKSYCNQSSASKKRRRSTSNTPSSSSHSEPSQPTKTAQQSLTNTPLSTSSSQATEPAQQSLTNTPSSSSSSQATEPAQQSL
jgi:hypothetical protein